MKIDAEARRELSRLMDDYAVSIEPAWRMSERVRALLSRCSRIEESHEPEARGGYLERIQELLPADDEADRRVEKWLRERGMTNSHPAERRGRVP